MIGFLLLLHAATPVILSVAEVEGAQSSDIALVETQLTKEIAARLDREVKLVQVPSDCRDLERCAGALAKAQGTDEVFLLRLIQGPLSLRVEALRYRTSLEPLTAVGTLRPLDRDRVGEILGPLLESMLVFERRKVSVATVPAPLPEVSSEGSAWPWVFAGAGLVAGGRPWAWSPPHRTILRAFRCRARWIRPPSMPSARTVMPCDMLAPAWSSPP